MLKTVLDFKGKMGFENGEVLRGILYMVGIHISGNIGNRSETEKRCVWSGRTLSQDFECYQEALLVCFDQGSGPE